MSSAAANPGNISLADFIASREAAVPASGLRHAERVEMGVPVYDGDTLRKMNSDALADVRREWADCWLEGAGIIAISGFFAEVAPVDAMSAVFASIFERELAENGGGDHFAAQGANRRIWNVLEKSAVADPQAFVDYYRNPLLGAVSEAWLGPAYQFTAQVNLVPPGGAAQQAHRDYHLGFLDDEVVARYPLHAQTMSARLTLQGAIAHVDMPLESGPTRLLPGSQRYALGYQLYRRDELQRYFDEHAVQLPLAKGDAVFFGPALMHAAGSNRSIDVQRLGNLLQISSTFGRPMEVVDRARMQRACYPLLAKAGLSEAELDTLTTVLSDSYPFPTNLDRDAPEGSMTPTSGRALLLRALENGHSVDQFAATLDDYAWRRRSH